MQEIVATAQDKLGEDNINSTGRFTQWGYQSVISMGLEYIKTEETKVAVIKGVIQKPKDFVSLRRLDLCGDDRIYVSLDWNGFMDACGANSENTSIRIEPQPDTWTVSSNGAEYTEAYIKYFAIPQDDDGFPLVPNYAYEAVEQFIIFTATARLRRRLPLKSRGQIPMSEVESEKAYWLWLRRKAKGDKNQPTQFGMREHEIAWNRLDKRVQQEVQQHLGSCTKGSLSTKTTISAADTYDPAQIPEAIISLTVTNPDDILVSATDSLDCNGTAIASSLTGMTLEWVFTLNDDSEDGITATITGAAYSYTLSGADTTALDAIGLTGSAGMAIEDLDGLIKNVAESTALAYSISVQLTVTDTCGSHTTTDTIPVGVSDVVIGSTRDLLVYGTHLIFTDGGNGRIRMLDLTDTTRSWTIVEGLDDPYGIDSDESALVNSYPTMYFSEQGSAEQISTLTFDGGDVEDTANWTTTVISVTAFNYTRGLSVDKTHPQQNGKPILWLSKVMNLENLIYNGVTWDRNTIVSNNQSSIRAVELGGDIFWTKHSDDFRCVVPNGTSWELPSNYDDGNIIAGDGNPGGVVYDTTGDLFEANRLTEVALVGSTYYFAESKGDGTSGNIHIATVAGDKTVKANWTFTRMTDSEGDYINYSIIALWVDSGTLYFATSTNIYSIVISTGVLTEIIGTETSGYSEGGTR